MNAPYRGADSPCLRGDTANRQCALDVVTDAPRAPAGSRLVRALLVLRVRTRCGWCAIGLLVRSAATSTGPAFFRTGSSFCWSKRNNCSGSAACRCAKPSYGSRFERRAVRRRALSTALAMTARS